MNLNYKLFLGIVMFVIGTKIQAQENDLVRGSILVRVEKDADLLKIIDENTFLNGSPTRLHPQRKLSENLCIWELAFDFNLHKEKQILEKIQQHPLCKAAQVNRVIKKRITIPNDPLFGNQWQYINSGAGGGLPDADIDAELAWDISTGGLTALGDTIVACIIDDGLDLTHADMSANRWFNWNEIPGNGLDDDGNGFTDDFRGWNAYHNNDDISGGTFGNGHGTPVAGIVGAKGNNNLGVSGVNWNIKLLTVVGGGDEADAIAAYDYPLTLRKTYNQSGGQYGAFVVCTNASWGVDNTTAASAPLWCAIYDSLGACGILNAGATTNSNTNVDVVGDLPTSCPSDFLIAVTNSDNTDQKIPNAGFGIQSIDLAAPGEGAFTVSTPNTYAAFNGTSAATPHVAGAIALLYSAPCRQLAYNAKTDPLGTALLVKDYIFRGVDTLASLQGITSTGGRLNLHKSMLLATQTNCQLTGCYQPFGLNTTSITDSSAHLYWSNVDSVLNGYIFRYRALGDTNWINGIVTDSSADLSGLLACTDYEWQVAADCGTNINFSASRIFRTANCCLAPSNIQLSRIMPDFAEFNWAFDANVISSLVEYRPLGDTAWTVYNTSNNSILITNLDSCTDYELRIISQCATNFNNRYSSVIPFRTSGCGACLDRTYCAAFTGDSGYEWISEVNLGQIQNISASNNGYANFTGITTNLSKGQSYPVNLSMSVNPSATANWRWKVWVDYNQDGILDNVSELAYSSGSITTMQLSVNGNIFIPQNALNGLTRMRVAMKWGLSDISSCGSYPYGEVEDYCVNITENTSNVYSGDDNNVISIFPNPTYNVISVQKHSDHELPFSIMNCNGVSFYSSILSDDIQKIDLSDLPAGMYFISVGKKVLKLIKL